MKATSSGVEELAQGRDPNEHCRPATSSRGGFMESQGTQASFVCVNINNDQMG